MPKDIYTLDEIVTPSEEHIVPRSLGGRLARVGLIDKKTNDRFGDSIDAALDEALRSARILLGAKSSDGKPPRALDNVLGADGKRYRVESGGVIVPAPDIVTTLLESGDTQITGTVPNTESVRRMLRKHARRSGKSLDDLMQTFMATSRDLRVAPPEMNFELNLWRDEPYRAIAKIGGNLVALSAPGVLPADEFERVRRFVLDGTIPEDEPVVAADFELTEGCADRLDHFVKVEVDDSGRTVALVVFFRFLAFVVNLGTLSVPRDFRTSYRVDQLSGVHWLDEPSDLDIPVPSFTQSETHCGPTLLALANKQIALLKPRLLAKQHDLWLERLVTPHFEKFLREVGDTEPTEAQREALFGSLIMEVTEELAPLVAQSSEEKRRRRNES